MRFSELRCKEIINISNGHRLGYVCDVEIEFPEGRLKALIVPGPCRFFGLFGREPDFLIPLDCVTRTGEDIILVEIQGSYGRSKRKRKNYF
ncbi:MAG: YlmC/YmxH family sporulation protein [Oscillospiraceae bacterium]|nr:YlmC/YmxH family sporulation protein [Oscillospiraceae bacterium]